LKELKSIIVTGGAGYIGSHTVVELLNQGYSVHIVDNLSNSDLSIIERINKITGVLPKFTNLDLRDKVAVDAFFDGLSEVDGIIHFAALKSVGDSVNNPIDYYENNLLSLTNLLRAACKSDIGYFVFSSSCTVYGEPEILPVTEETPIGFTPSPYGATKQMCERILDDFTHSVSNFKAVSLRYFNPLGAHESKLIGELPSGVPNNLLPYITQTAAGVRDCLSVFGNDYNTHDGTAVRDYIHVTDLANAHICALKYLTKQSKSIHDKLNVGTGVGLSVLDVIKSFEKTSGIKLNYKIVDRREGDVESIYADSTKAETLLNWKAKYSIDDMTRSAWEWEQKLRGV